MKPSEPFGCYRLEPSAELLAFVERAFVVARAPAEREAARAEALAELHGAELVLEASGAVVSRANGVEFLRVELTPAELARDEFSFEKAPGLRVVVTRSDAHTLVAVHPDKPPLTFRRAPAER